MLQVLRGGYIWQRGHDACCIVRSSSSQPTTEGRRSKAPLLPEHACRASRQEHEHTAKGAAGDEQKSEITRVRWRQTVPVSADSPPVESFFRRKSIASLFGSCNRNTGRFWNKTCAKCSRAWLTQAQKYNQTLSPPRNQASSSPEEGPFQVQVRSLNRPPGSRKKCSRRREPEQSVAGKWPSEKGKRKAETIPGRSPISLAWHPGTFQARRRHAEISQHKEKANDEKQIALLNLARDWSRASVVSADRPAACFSSPFPASERPRRGWDENATRRTRDQVELCNDGSNRLRSVPVVWVALTRHAWSRAARRSRAFAVSLSTATAEHRARRSAVATTPSARYGLTQPATPLRAILCGFDFGAGHERATTRRPGRWVRNGH